jgi:iron(III) transport system permease protein
VDARTWSLVLNTLLLSGAACAVSVPLGGLLAWLLLRTDVPGRRAALAALGVMLFVPLYLQAAAWRAGFDEQGWLTLWGGLPVWLSGRTGAVWIHAVAAVPWVVLIVGAGMRLVEPELEEQALLDGSPSQVFFHVTLRSTLPAIGAAALWVAITTAGEMTVTDLFAVRTYAEEVYTRQRIGELPGDAPLGVLPGIAVVAGLASAAMVLCGSLLPRDRSLSLRRSRRVPLGGRRWPAAAALAGAMAMVMAAPLASLFYKAGLRVVQTDAGRLRTWSAVKCAGMVVSSPWLHARELGWSGLLGCLAASAAVAMALALAWWSRRGGARAMVVAGVAAVCLAVPGPVLGLAVIALLNRPASPWLWYLYDRSIFAPWLCLTVRALPAAILVLWHGLRSVPEAVLESAAIDGAGGWARFWRIVLPMRWPVVAVAWLVAFAVSLGDLAASILVVPPGLATLSIRVFDLLHAGVDDRVAGICLFVVGAMLAIGALIAWLTRTAAGLDRRGHGSLCVATRRW